MLLAPGKHGEKTIPGKTVYVRDEECKKKRKQYLTNGDDKSMRSRRRLFPWRTRLLFAGTINPSMRSLLHGRSNSGCFWPPPHYVQFGVPKLCFVYERFSYTKCGLLCPILRKSGEIHTSTFIRIIGVTIHRGPRLCRGFAFGFRMANP